MKESTFAVENISGLPAVANRVKLPLVVIVGPTASGKTELAIRIAKKFNGEIISADSRAIYRGLDIGTAKPTSEEQQGIVHWGIDIVDPGERFTTANFKVYAQQKISEIRSRGHLPIIAGGTGLYIDSVLYDFKFTACSNNLDERRKLENKSLEQLIYNCEKNNIKLPKNIKNKRHIINAILRKGEDPLKNDKIISNTILVGIATDRDILRSRIEERAKNIVSNTTINEAIRATEKWGWYNEAMTGNVYPLIKQYLGGTIDEIELERKLCVLDWRLAKRQLTWLRRNKDIKWFSIDEAWIYIVNNLDKSS
jgi:tRNA dimethylallyltransferase